MTETGDDKERPGVSFPSSVMKAEPAKITSTGSGGSQLRQRRKIPKFKNVANMVMQLQRQSLLQTFDLDADDPNSTRSEASSPYRASGHSAEGGANTSTTTDISPQPSSGRDHRRYYSTTHVPYTKEDNEKANTTPTHLDSANLPMFSPSKAPTSNFLDHAQHLENLFQVGPPTDHHHHHHPFEDLHVSPRPYGGAPTILAETNNSQGGIHPNEEHAHLIDWSSSHRTAASTSAGRDVEEGSYQNQSYPEDTAPLMANNLNAAAAANKNRRPTFGKRCWAALMAILQPHEIWGSIQQFLATTVCLFMIPCLVGAAVLFYPLQNPDLEFLPSQAHLPWFLLFAVRQSVTFTLAQMTQWVLQILTIRTTLFVRAAGPLPALVVMQSVGWPCLLSLWGCWNLFLLHGDSPFVKHWLYFTGIRLFSVEYNWGDGIIGSELYGRILAAMIVLGVASAAKRTFVALYLSRRMLTYYRSQLEKVMSQVKLVVEVAELASRTDQPGFEELLASAHEGQLALETRKSRFVETVPTFKPEKKNSKNASTESLGASSDESDDDDGDDDEAENNNSGDELDEDSTAVPDDPLQQVLDEIELPIQKMKWNALKQQAVNDRYAVKVSGDESTAGTGKAKRHASGSASVSSRGLGMIFPYLERWQEPNDKGRKGSAPALHDILQFKKAIAFMETDYPFSPTYGSAVSRKVCVKNAVKVYRRLQRYTPDQPVLPFDVIGALAYQEDGELDEDRAIDLLRVFLPDKDDTVSMLAFVQSCDNVYKQLRFLRASLSNSSKIDSVLEDIFNVAFYAILGLVALAVCGFNPWPLLVSFSTLTVSFAFAFGPSVAKNVEGVLMIAVRRPYDIGDRITIIGAENVANPTAADTWLVEDISLTTTVLRYASTNEQATINNASVANSRIVNHARSPRASVTIRIRFSIDASQRQLDDFRRNIEKFFEDRPRLWVGLIHYRAEKVDSDSGFVEYVYRAQHVKAWQDMAAIMINKGEWERYADTLATEMGIIFDSPPRQMTVGLGLAPESDTDKATDDRKRVAAFIRSISAASPRDRTTESEKTSSDEQVYDVIAEYADADAGDASMAALQSLIGDGATGGDSAASGPGPGGAD